MGFLDGLKSGAGNLLGAAGGAAYGPIGAILGQAVGGGIADREKKKQEEAQWGREFAAQKEFAQMGVRWKAEDARAAGLHPLAAMGAQTVSYAPQAVGGSGYGGSAFADMGQNLSNIMSATSTANEKEMHALQIQGMQLDNQNRFMDAQIKQQTLDQNDRGNPGFPGDQNFISGQGNARSKIVEKPLERTSSLPGSPQSEPGAIPDVGWAKTATGVIPIPSKDVKERTEDVMPHEWAHYIRNNVAPNWGGGTKPPKSALPSGATKWKWNFTAQEFQPYFPPKGGGSSRRSFDYRSKPLL